MEVGESWVGTWISILVEVFEFALALVEVPELLLGSGSNKGTLSFEGLLLFLALLHVDFLGVGNGAHHGLFVQVEGRAVQAAEFARFKELVTLRARCLALVQRTEHRLLFLILDRIDGPANVDFGELLARLLRLHREVEAANFILEHELEDLGDPVLRRFRQDGDPLSVRALQEARQRNGMNR